MPEDFETQLVPGLVTTDKRDPEFHPGSYKQQIQEIKFRAAPFVAIIEGISRQKTPSFHYKWPVQPYINQYGTVNDAYTDQGSTPVAGASTKGSTIYLQVKASDAKRIIPTDQLIVADTDNSTFARLYVESKIVKGDTDSFVQCVLRADDTDQVLAAANMQFLIGGNAQSEYAGLPDPLFDDPVYFENYLQCMAEALQFSDRELRELDRLTPKQKMRAKKQAFRRLKQKKQLAYMWSKRAIDKDENGNRITTTDGVRTVLEDWEDEDGVVGGNIFNFKTDPEFAGAQFPEKGLKFLHKIAEKLSRKGEKQSKICATSSLVMFAINEAIEHVSYYKLETKQAGHGIKVHKLYTPTQDWDIIEDPVFTSVPMLRRSMFVSEKGLLSERYGAALKYIPDQSNKAGGKYFRTGIKEGWIEDAGLEYKNLDAQGWIDGIGLDNTVAQ